MCFAEHVSTQIGEGSWTDAAARPIRRFPRRRLPRATALAGGLAIVVLGGLTLAACSSDGGGTTPESTVEVFLHALGNKDTAGACAVVAYNRQPLAGDDITLCRSGFDAVVSQVATADELALLRKAQVTGSTITGDAAVVTADQQTGVPAAYKNDVTLVRVDGHWYIDTPR